MIVGTFLFIAVVCLAGPPLVRLCGFVLAVGVAVYALYFIVAAAVVVVGVIAAVQVGRGIREGWRGHA